jgi:hypothetical protein
MILKQISNVEGGRNGHIFGKLYNIGIVVDLLCDSEWSIHAALQFAVGSSWKSIFAQVYHHQVTFLKEFNPTMLVCRRFVLTIGLLQILAHLGFHLLNPFCRVSCYHTQPWKLQ